MKFKRSWVSFCAFEELSFVSKSFPLAKMLQALPHSHSWNVWLFPGGPMTKGLPCCQNVTVFIAAPLRFISIFSPPIFKDSVTEMPLATHWESDHNTMTLTYFSVTAHVWLTALPQEPWSFPASSAWSKDSGYLTVDTESSLPSLFSQSQTRFEYKLLWF